MMALHPDDPPMPFLRGTPRLVYQPQLYQKVLDLVPSPCNGIDFCMGSIQEMTDGNIYDARLLYTSEIQLSNVTNDQMKETELVNTYTAQGVAGIAISPLSATISPEALKVSSDKGVKICVANTAMDSYPFSIAAYTSDNYAFCKQKMCIRDRGRGDPSEGNRSL